MFQGKTWMKLNFYSLYFQHIELSSLIRWTMKGLRRRHWQDVFGAQSGAACAWHWIWHYVTLRDITWQLLCTKGDQRYFSRCFWGVLWKTMHYSLLCLRRMPTRWQEVEEALQTRPAGGTARLAMWRHCALAGDNSLPQNLNGAEEHKSPERKNKGIHREARWSSSATIP